MDALKRGTSIERGGSDSSLVIELVARSRGRCTAYVAACGAVSCNADRGGGELPKRVAANKYQWRSAAVNSGSGEEDTSTPLTCALRIVPIASCSASIGTPACAASAQVDCSQPTSTASGWGEAANLRASCASSRRSTSFSFALARLRMSKVTSASSAAEMAVTNSVASSAGKSDSNRSPTLASAANRFLDRSAAWAVSASSSLALASKSSASWKQWHWAGWIYNGRPRKGVHLPNRCLAQCKQCRLWLRGSQGALRSLIVPTFSQSTTHLGSDSSPVRRPHPRSGSTPKPTPYVKTPAPTPIQHGRR